MKVVPAGPSGVSAKQAGGPQAPAAKPKPHQAMANALAKQLGGKADPSLPALPPDAKANDLKQLLNEGWETALGGIKSGLNQSEGVWLLQLAAHPAATQAVHDAIASKLAEQPKLTSKLKESPFSDFLMGLSPTVSAKAAAAAQVAGQDLPSKAAAKTVGTLKGPKALAKGAGGANGNALNARLAIMSGKTQVKGTQDALGELLQALANGQVPTSLPLSALDKLPLDKAGGLVLQLDGDKVSGQRVIIRKVNHPEHGPGLEIGLKLRTGEDIRAVEDKIAASGGSIGQKTVEVMAFKDGQYEIDTSQAGYTFKDGNGYGSTAAQAHILEDTGRFRLEMLDDKGPQAARGLVRLRVFEKEGDLTANLSEAIEQAGLKDAFADSNDDNRGKLNQLRALWQRAPKTAQAFATQDLDKLPQADIDAALKAAGVDPHHAADMDVKEVFPGHFTSVNPKQAEEYKDLGVEFLFSGVRKMESVVAILKGDGLMSTMERYQRGMIIAGASSDADIKAAAPTMCSPAWPPRAPKASA